MSDSSDSAAGRIDALDGVSEMAEWLRENPSVPTPDHVEHGFKVFIVFADDVDQFRFLLREQNLRYEDNGRDILYGVRYFAGDVEWRLRLDAYKIRRIKPEDLKAEVLGSGFARLIPTGEDSYRIEKD